MPVRLSIEEGRKYDNPVGKCPITTLANVEWVGLLLLCGDSLRGVLNGVEIDKYANIRFLLSYDRDFLQNARRNMCFVA